MMWSLIICALHKVLVTNIKEDEMGDACTMYDRDKKCIQDFSQNI
jgi:hypothetical protein